MHKPNNVKNATHHPGVPLNVALVWAGKPVHMGNNNFQACDSLRRNGLHYAACSNDVITTSDLLQKGVNCGLQDSRGCSPLHYAVMHESYEVLETLLESPACVVDAQNSNGQTALFIAAREGDLKSMQLLIQANANPNICDVEEATPLHVAAANNQVEAIKMLVGAGAFLNPVDNCGDTPLHWAVREEAVASVNSLIQHPQINVSALNEDGETAHDLARTFSAPSDIVMKLQAGSSIASSNSGNVYQSNSNSIAFRDQNASAASGLAVN